MIQAGRRNPEENHRAIARTTPAPAALAGHRLEHSWLLDWSAGVSWGSFEISRRVNQAPLATVRTAVRDSGVRQGATRTVAFGPVPVDTVYEGLARLTSATGTLKMSLAIGSKRADDSNLSCFFFFSVLEPPTVVTLILVELCGLQICSHYPVRIPPKQDASGRYRGSARDREGSPVPEKVKAPMDDQAGWDKLDVNSLEWAAQPLEQAPKRPCCQKRSRPSGQEMVDIGLPRLFIGRLHFNGLYIWGPNICRRCMSSFGAFKGQLVMHLFC